MNKIICKNSSILSAILLCCATFIMPFCATAHAHECFDETNKLTVTGYGKTKILAEIAAVNLSIEVKEANIDLVQKLLSNKSNSVIDALRSSKAKKISTEQLLITPNYSRKEPYRLLGHTGRMRISFESDVKSAGKLIAKAMSTGSNKIDGIYIKPSDEVLNRAKATSLKIATENATKQADIVLDALNLAQISVAKIEIHPSSYYSPRPFMAKSFSAEARLGATNSASAPEITAKEQEVEVRVTLKILYE